ncbi:MAG: pyridoxal-phosphate dependent enzyme [Ferruginibacter sp.]
MKMLFKTPEIEFTDIDTNPYTTKNIRLIVARLDKIHPIISGNKLYKLHFFLEQAIQSSQKTILTFGGAYSNHLAATAYACKLAGLRSIGIVRGERPATLSHTLVACELDGMHLKFISRNEYDQKEQEYFQDTLQNEFGECLVVPEGGYHPLGSKGASLIMDEFHFLNATHVCTAVGTATTLAGLMQNRHNNETMIAVPVLKQMTDIKERISFLNGKDQQDKLVIFDEYHFGGYAKKTNALINFMNELYERNKLPTDFVYTAKMMYAITDKIRTGYFEDGNIIVCLHTGGLQGNASLPAGTLVF